MAMPKELPLLRNWQDFEDLCRDLWSEIWQDSETKLHGRSGQGDQGVDVYGRPGGGEVWHGVQCKKKSWGQRLEEGEIRKEVAAALAFEPKLSHLVFATTAPRDAKAQKVVREITAKHKKDGLFTVEIADWQEITERVLRDHSELRDRYFGDSMVRILGSELELVRQAYLQDLWTRLTPLPVTAMGFGDSHRPVPLLEVYTALDVSLSLKSRDKGDDVPEDRAALDSLALATALRAEPAYLEGLAAWERANEERKAEKEKHLGLTARPLAAIEAVAAAPRLVLIGDGGGGKSTFARYLTLCHAGEWLQSEEAHLRLLERGDSQEGGRPATWPHGPRLPLFVELRHLVASKAFPKPSEVGEARHLLAFLKAEAKSRKVKGFGKLLRAHLGSKGGGVLLILDGLDETPEGEKARQRLRDLITSWAGTYPECRILVTSRPYAYSEESKWRLEGFGEAILAELTDGQIQSFLRGWNESLVRRGQLDRDLARPRAARLWRELQAGYLRRLAGRPLMLTMMANLHARGGGHLPLGGRAEVYKKSVELLLDQWNEGRGLLQEKGSVAEYLGISLERLIEALEELAFEVHRGQTETPEEERGAEMPAALLWEKLDKYRESAAESQVDDLRVRDYLSQRSGILLEERPKWYRFPHRSYQEYLAAGYLCQDEEFPDNLLAEIEDRPELWREIVIFLGGRLAKPPLWNLWALVQGLLPGNLPPEDGSLPDPDSSEWYRILYAALAFQESGLWRQEKQRQSRHLQPLRAWLAAAMEVGVFGAADSIFVGQVLGRIEDRRPGVGLRDGLPDIVWRKVPTGTFLYGEEMKKKNLRYSFEISKFPVTNIQYQTFVDAGGYQEKGQKYWSSGGTHWRRRARVKSPAVLSEPLNLPNYPRVEVSWWEAEAYCSWLSEVTGQEVRLATEEEWEKAARGKDGHTYPWGDDWEEGWCNASERGFLKASVVGSFPKDQSPYGVRDLAGNVRDWCFSAMGSDRLIRGGCWADGVQSCRSAYRRGMGPDYHSELLGFHLVKT